MVLLSLFAVLAPLLAVPAYASSCWRDTPCTGPKQQAFPGPWDKYNYSPESRTVEPVRVLDQNHKELSSWGRHGVTLRGNGTLRIIDFGKEVGGVATLSAKVCGAGSVGLAFSEALNFTGYESDSSNDFASTDAPDGAIFTPEWTSHQCGTRIEYAMPYARQRGGFRYISIYTLSANGTSPHAVEAMVDSLQVEIAFEPTWPNLQAYQGYFYSSDDLLNKIWYAGAYTLQSNMIAADALRDELSSGWAENETLGLDPQEYPTAFVDGAKRDRTVWSGDLGLATRSVMVSTGEVIGTKGDFEVLFKDSVISGPRTFCPMSEYNYM
jgi:hypothetical protein